MDTPATTRDPLLGALVHERYRIVRVLGEGGMGRVYYAEQRMGATTRPVALKVLRPARAESVARQRFVRECELLAQLTHPSTVRIYDFGALPDGRLFLAMEYVQGRSLAAAIAEGPMPLPVVERLVAQIGGALVEAHRRGIVHRDLKPDNILLAHNPDEGEFAKLLDFGIAKQEGVAASAPFVTGEGLVVGTPAYMSPEQLAGEAVDERSDVYALGLVVFEMLTGKHPFEARTPLEWAVAHSTKPVPSFDAYPSTRGLPPSKREAIVCALAKNPAERLASVRAFLEAFLGPSRPSSVPFSNSNELRSASVGSSSSPHGGQNALGVPNDPDIVRLPTQRTVPWLVGGLALAVLGALVLAAPRCSKTESEALAMDAGLAEASVDGGADARAAARTWTWLRMVTGSDRVDDVTSALGPPDGRCARIAPGGKILLELEGGARIHTDGSPGPDLEIVVQQDSMPYRVDVLVERRQERTQVGADVVGSIAIDVDQFDRAEFRYVRIKNRNRRGTVCLDAVGVFAGSRS